MILLKAFKFLTWFCFIFICVVNYYDYRKEQWTLENLTLLLPLIVLVIVDYIEFKQRDRNVNNDWSKRV